MHDIVFDIICELEADVELIPPVQVGTGLVKLAMTYSRCGMCLLQYWMLCVQWMWSGPPGAGRDRIGSVGFELFKMWHVINVMLGYNK